MDLILKMTFRSHENTHCARIRPFMPVNRLSQELVLLSLLKVIVFAQFFEYFSDKCEFVHARTNFQSRSLNNRMQIKKDCQNFSWVVGSCRFKQYGCNFQNQMSNSIRDPLAHETQVVIPCERCFEVRQTSRCSGSPDSTVV